MIKKIDSHTENNHRKVVHKDMIGDVKPIEAIWSFKRKRRPDGYLIKYKPLLYSHGDMQEYGEHYWETYKPIVNWAIIRFILTFAILNKMHTRSIDFTLKFSQVNTDVDIFMELPVGADVPKRIKHKE